MTKTPRLPVGTSQAMAPGWLRRARWALCAVAVAAIGAFMSVFPDAAAPERAAAQAASAEQQPAAQQPTQAQQPAAPPLQPSAQAPGTPAQAALTRSDAEVVVTLIRTTLVAVHQANLTGNYTVLRDLGAPGFRDKNSAADLAQIFAPIRQRKIDLGPVVFLDPQLSQAARTDQGMLHLVGKLATRPVPVGFELLFQPVNGVWQLFGVSIAPIQEQAMTTASAPTAAAAPAPTAPSAKKAGPMVASKATPRHRSNSEARPSAPAQ